MKKNQQRYYKGLYRTMLLKLALSLFCFTIFRLCLSFSAEFTPESSQVKICLAKLLPSPVKKSLDFSPPRCILYNSVFQAKW